MKNNKLIIVSVKYEEPEWQQTKVALLGCGVPVIFMDRGGVGSLAEAYNKGFAKSLEIGSEYVWFVSNPVFDTSVMHQLVGAMKGSKYAAIQPTYSSDHAHLCPSGKTGLNDVPFIEFTCPMVRSDVSILHQLDRAMPYWGHDLDWSYRVKQAGYEIGVLQGAEVQHTYLRHSKKHPVTAIRHLLRKQSNAATTKRLEQLYGENWKEVLNYSR